MKAKVSFISGLLTIAVALAMTTGTAYADGGTAKVYAKGETNTPAGDYVVRATNDVYHFQGEELEVYKVYYDDPSMNMNIAVKKGMWGRSFIAYTDDYSVFYNCDRNGFGVRKIMFTNADVQKKFNSVQYQKQTVLQEQDRIEKKEAIDLIATYLPGLKTT